MHLRKYRKNLVDLGQFSSPYLANLVNKSLNVNLKDLNNIKVVDIGCGLGSQIQNLRRLNKKRFKNVSAIDWSPATVDYHKTSKIYTECKLAESSFLPYQDNEFDLAICMENLEHLYGDKSIAAINEMKRISKMIVISTPFPQACINFEFLKEELFEAQLDPFPITAYDYVCLESAIHKSTIFPQSLIQSGFKMLPGNHGIYFANSLDINIDKIECIGIDEDLIDFKSLNEEELKLKYINLLIKSAQLSYKIISHKSFKKIGLSFKGLDYKTICKYFEPPIIKAVIKILNR